MRIQLTGFIGLLLCFAGHSFAAESGQWIHDSGGMPRCLIGEDHVLSFLWNRDPYERRIRVRRFARSAREHVTPSGEKAQEMPLVDYYCSAQYSRIYLAASTATLQKIPPTENESWFVPGQTSAFEFEVPVSEQQRLEQARLGGNVFHQETAAQIVEREKLTEFSIEKNQELTAKYGVGFTAEVFREVVEKDPKNRSFESELLTRIEKLSKKKSFDRDLSFEVIVVKGFGYSLTNNRLFRDLVKDLQDKIDVDVIDTDTLSFGTVEQNTQILTHVLNQELSKGKNIMVLAGCVGAAEALGALAHLKDKLESTQRPAGYGRVLAFAGLSPMLTGSFVADWAMGFPQSVFVSRGAYKIFKQKDPNVGSRKALTLGLKSLTEEELTKFMSSVVPNLPKSPIYFSMAGVKTGNALAGDESLRNMQDAMIRRILVHSSHFAANDGFLRYPGSVIPNSWGVEHYAIIAEASHALLDGSYHTYSLEPGHRSRIVVIRSILELLEEKALKK